MRASGYKFTVQACEAAVGLSYSDEIKVFEWTDEKDEFAADKDSQWSQWAARAPLGALQGLGVRSECGLLLWCTSASRMHFSLSERSQGRF